MRSSVSSTSQRSTVLGAGNSIFAWSIVLCLLFVAMTVFSAAGVKVEANSSSASSPTNSYVASQQPTGPPENLWLEIDESTVNAAQRAAGPRTYRTLRLNRLGLASILAQAPLEFSKAAETKPVELDLPLADGSYQTFRVVESSIMAPELAARFPEIKTYRGYSIEDPSITTRFDWTPTGFHAIILGAKKTVLIEPYAQGNTEDYIAYFQTDVPVGSFACDVTTAEQEAAIAQAHTHSRKISPAVTSGTNLRTLSSRCSRHRGIYTDLWRRDGEWRIVRNYYHDELSERHLRA